MYIRPICLIQVERTGRDQRHPGVVHADDARDYLIRFIVTDEWEQRLNAMLAA